MKQKNVTLCAVLCIYKRRDKAETREPTQERRTKRGRATGKRLKRRPKEKDLKRRPERGDLKEET